MLNFQPMAQLESIIQQLQQERDRLNQALEALQGVPQSKKR